MHVRVGLLAGIAAGLFMPEIRGYFGGLAARRHLEPITTPQDFQQAFIEARRRALETPMIIEDDDK